MGRRVVTEAGYEVVMVSKNVTEAVTPPKPQKKEIRVLTSEQTKRLIRVVRGDKFEAIYIMTRMKRTSGRAYGRRALTLMVSKSDQD